MEPLPLLIVNFAGSIDVEFNELRCDACVMCLCKWMQGHRGIGCFYNSGTGPQMSGLSSVLVWQVADSIERLEIVGIVSMALNACVLETIMLNSEEILLIWL
jgi:selenocysteine lyase/cysteine desulfurase